MSRRIALVLAALSVAIRVHAQEPPTAGVTRVTVPLSQPKQDSDRAEKPLDRALFDLWVPEDAKTIRGVLVNPFYRGTTGQEHWRAACRHWGFGIVATNFFGIAAEDFGTLDEAMVEFARVTGRPELAHVPFLFVGMSAGGGMSTRLVEVYPDRTIAACPVCLEVGPRDEASRKVPILTIFGERDGKQLERLFAKLPDERRADAQWALAVQWGRKHEFGRANNLAMPFFDAVITARYPADASPADGPVALKTLDPVGTGFLGHCDKWETSPAPISSAGYFDGDEAELTMTAWLPNESVARVWQAFVVREPVLELKTPAGLGDGQKFVVHPAGKPIPFDVTERGNHVIGTYDLFDGDRRIVTAADGIGTLPGLEPGIHAIYVVATAEDGTVLMSRPNTIIVGR